MPGQVLDNNRLQLYRPLVESNRVMYQKCVPSEITDFRDLKSPKERVESFRENTISAKENIQDNTQVQPVRSAKIYRQYRSQLPRQQSIQTIQVQERGLTQKEEQLHQPMNRQNQNRVVLPVDRRKTEQQKSSETQRKGRQQESKKTKERQNK